MAFKPRRALDMAHRSRPYGQVSAPAKARPSKFNRSRRRQASAILAKGTRSITGPGFQAHGHSTPICEASATLTGRFRARGRWQPVATCTRRYTCLPMFFPMPISGKIERRKCPCLLAFRRFRAMTFNHGVLGSSPSALTKIPGELGRNSTRSPLFTGVF